MSRARSVTVERGIVSVDGRRRFLQGARLTPRDFTDGLDDAAVATALAALASSGANTIVIDPHQSNSALTRLADDLDLVVLVDCGGRRQRSRWSAPGSDGPQLKAPEPWRLGWEAGDERDLPHRLRRSWRPPRLLHGFGAPSIATDDPWLDRHESNWQLLGEPGGPNIGDADRDCLLRHTPPAAFDDIHEWAAATRAYQAMVIRFHVETARRLRYAPLGLVAADALCDPRGGVSPALLGPDGAPKEALRALTAALRPVTVIADRLPPHLHGDEALAVDVHVVNDSADRVAGATIEAELAWADGSQRYGFRGTVEADSVQRVGTIPFVVPAVSGPLTLEVRLRHADTISSCAYRSDVFADPHDH